MMQMQDPNMMMGDPNMMQQIDPNQMQHMNADQQMELQRQFEMEQQQQYQNQIGGDQQQRHYFDSIETDEFIMPPKFEVEIRMQDNSVSYTIKLLIHQTNPFIFDNIDKTCDS